MLAFTTALWLIASAKSAEAAWQACIDHTASNPEWAHCGDVNVQRMDIALNTEWKRLIGETQRRI